MAPKRRIADCFLRGAKGDLVQREAIAYRGIFIVTESVWLYVLSAARVYCLAA